MDLALTLDYELYGNGEGDVLNQIIRPTNELLKLCENFQAKLTIFFEIVEYWKLKQVYTSRQTMGYSTDPTELMENQISEAYRRGHDIQLHIHPQWLEAEYTNGRWRVSNESWSLSSVPPFSSGKCRMGLRELLAKGKETLEAMIRPYGPEYECTILRAGGLNIQPSEKIVQAMRSVGLKADSSVYPGGFADSDYASYDYRKISTAMPFWATSTDDLLDIKCSAIKATSNHVIYELPIFAMPIRRFKKYDIERLKTKLINRSAIRTSRSQAQTRIRNKAKLKYFLEEESVTWDFCLLSYAKMKSFLSKAMEIHEQSKYGYHPFILIGHSKEFRVSSGLEKFLSYIRHNMLDIRFITLTDLLNKIDGR